MISTEAYSGLFDQGTARSRMKQACSEPLVGDGTKPKERERDGWDKLFNDYGLRREQLLRALGMDESIARSKMAKEVLGENCQDFAKASFQHRLESTTTPIALLDALSDLAEMCICEHPCNPDEALGRKPSRPEKLKRMLGLASEASLFAALCQLPNDKWDKLISLLEKNGQDAPKTNDIQLKDGDVLSWIKKILALSVQNKSDFSPQTLLQAIIVTAPQSLNLSRSSDGGCDGLTNAGLQCFEAYPTQTLGLILVAVLILYLFGPTMPCIRAVHKRSCLIDSSSYEESVRMSGGSKSKVKVTEPSTARGDYTLKLRMPTCGSMRSPAYEKPEVVRDTLLSYAAVSGIIVLLIILLIQIT